MTAFACWTAKAIRPTKSGITREDNGPSAADGRGSSLELRDPFADNSSGLAWAASDESQRSSWQTYRYRGVAAASSVGPDGQWQELVMGMLTDGEVLLDDIQVIQDPGGAAIDLIQNGTFEPISFKDRPHTGV